MIEQPLVSISLPTYNQQLFVAESIESVLNQDYGNIEIVIGDDFSQDNTWDIVQKYQQNHPDKIKAFRNNENLGITGNCNKILKHCTGKYIAYTAGDDLYLPSKIRKQVDLMEKDRTIVLCYHDIEVFNSEDDSTIRFWNHGKCSNSPIIGSARKLGRAVIEKDTSFMAALSVMVRRESVPQTGYDQRIPYASDWLMWVDILMNAKKENTVEYIPDVFARYRMHNAGITNQMDKMISDQLVTLAIIESKYPEFVFSVNKSLGNLRYRIGQNKINNNNNNNNNNYKEGRHFLFLSLFSGSFSWKTIYWLVISYLPFFRPKIELLREKVARWF